MGFSIQGKLTGLDAAIRSLRAVAPKVQKKIQRKALQEAGKPMAKAAKAKCPVSTESLNPWKGLLKKSIGTKTKTYRDSGVVVLVIGARTGFRQLVGIRTRGKNKGQPFYQDPSNIAHLVEFGTKHSRAKPFMRPAYDENKIKAVETFKRVVREELEKN